MFFIIVLTSFFALSSYVFTRGFQALPPSVLIKVAYSVLFIGGMLSFFLRMYLGDRVEERYALPLSEVGFTFIIALVYFAIFALGFDILRVLNYFFHIFPEIVVKNREIAKYAALGLSLITVFILLLIGSKNFNNPVVTKYELFTEKSLPKGGMRIVLASDIHLSSYINSNDLRRYVDLINSQNGDVVMLAGDIADRDVRPLIEHKVDNELARIKAEYGVYAITGNHEFYGGHRDEIYGLIRASGINLLLDSAHVSPFGFVVVGRDDRTNHKRKSLETIMSNINKEHPVILMDHQPAQLEDAVNNKIDIQLSGHTHNGQFWPGNLIVSAMFELAYGHMKKGETDIIVTSGLGLWGPKYRIGTKSEIVVIEWRQLPASTSTATAESATAESAKSTSPKSSASAESASKSARSAPASRK
jgi:predicted MPP superfamily phosphohydrolase